MATLWAFFSAVSWQNAIHVPHLPLDVDVACAPPPPRVSRRMVVHAEVQKRFGFPENSVELFAERVEPFGCAG